MVGAGSAALLLVDLRFEVFAYRAAGGVMLLASTGVAIVALLATVAFAGPPCLVAVAGSAAGVCSLAGTAAVLLSDQRDLLFGFAETAALVVLLAVVGLRAPARWAVLPGFLLGAAVVVRPLVGGATEVRVIVALVFALVATVAAAAGTAARLVLADRQRRAAATRDEQRTEFARELHDFVAHHVTGMVVQAQGALAIADSRPDLVVPALEGIEAAGAQAMASMRRVVGMLRTSADQPALAPLAAAGKLQELVDHFAAMSTAAVDLTVDDGFDELPVEVRATVHRVVMEALANVGRHAAEVRTVTVVVAVAGGQVRVLVADDGRPRHSSGDGYGLTGLRERVALLGGRLYAGRVEPHGWRVEACLAVGAP